MDAFGNDWNTAPACVLSTVWGTASIRDLAVEVGAVPTSPIRQVLTARRAGCAGLQSSARASLWICGQHKSVAHKPTGPTAAADNLNNLEISSLRATPGSPSEPALKATRHGCYHPFRRLCAGPARRSQEAMEWAKTAQSDKERAIFLEMVRTWTEAAVSLERKLEKIH
jgi:predicted Fe-S protein YdhL (DUF1289 family)